MVHAKKVHVLYKRNAYENETPTVRGLAAGNNNMRSVQMVNMETIIMILQTYEIIIIT